MIYEEEGDSKTKGEEVLVWRYNQTQQCFGLDIEPKRVSCYSMEKRHEAPTISEGGVLQSLL